MHKATKPLLLQHLHSDILITVTLGKVSWTTHWAQTNCTIQANRVNWIIISFYQILGYFSFIHSFIKLPRHPFLVRITVHPKPIQRTLEARWEYTLNSISDFITIKLKILQNQWVSDINNAKSQLFYQYSAVSVVVSWLTESQLGYWLSVGWLKVSGVTESQWSYWQSGGYWQSVRLLLVCDVTESQ